MRSPKDYRPVSTETRRIPLLRRVSLKWGKERDSVEEMGINLSVTGMFVRSDSPRAIGATAAFVMSLAEGEVPIEGIAEVAWIRDRDEGDSHPPGMGMRFLRVSGEGRRRIRETVERLVEETSAPAELRDLRLVVERTLEDIFAQRDEVEDLGRGASALAPPPRADAGAAVALSGSPPASRRLGWLLGLLLLAGIGTVAYLAGSGGRGTDLPELASSDRSPPQAPPAAPAAPGATTPARSSRT